MSGMKNYCSRCGTETDDGGDLHCRKILVSEVKKLLSLGKIEEAESLISRAQGDEDWERWKREMFVRFSSEPIRQRYQLKWDEEARLEREREAVADNVIATILNSTRPPTSQRELLDMDVRMLEKQMELGDLPLWERYKLVRFEKYADVHPILISYTQRKNWQDFKNVLNRENLPAFVHVTDESNIPSIRKYGGLYSNDAMKKYGIQPLVFASGELSRELDNNRGISDHIHLSVQKSPMMHAVEREGRIKPVTLKIDPGFVYAQETRFSDKNAVDNQANTGSRLEDFDRINFSVAKGRWTNEEEKKLFQAEILVKHHIPIEFITNLTP
jgi:hypothetical protein